MFERIRRRRLLAGLAAAVPATAGCIGGTPDEIPLDVENEGSREWELSVQVRQAEGDEPFLDETFVLAAGDQQSSVERLDSDETYVLSATLHDADTQLHEEVSTGGGTVSLAIEIGKGGELRTRKTVQ